jgi:hypothetical protein
MFRQHGRALQARTGGRQARGRLQARVSTSMGGGEQAELAAFPGQTGGIDTPLAPPPAPAVFRTLPAHLERAPPLRGMRALLRRTPQSPRPQ